jgi:hypothetical protein
MQMRTNPNPATSPTQNRNSPSLHRHRLTQHLDQTATFLVQSTNGQIRPNLPGNKRTINAEVQKAHQAYFDLIFEERSCKLDEIESIEPLPGDAFIAVARWSMGGYRRPNGMLRPPGSDRMSLVLVPRGDGLAIAHGANVPIDEEAASFDPIKRDR